MPEYLSPGVYIEEFEIGGKPIEGVSTSTAGFVGETERGPIDARLITDFGQYQRLYGGHAWKTEITKSYLPYAVEGFFANGGKRCFVGRVTGKNSHNASGMLQGKGEISVKAIGPGSWGNRIGVVIHEASMAKKEDTTEKIFKLVVFYWPEMPPIPVVDPGDRERIRDPNRREPKAHEEFDNLSWDPASANFYVKRIHGQSHLIEVSEGRSPTGSLSSAAGPEPVVAESQNSPPAQSSRKTRTDKSNPTDSSEIRFLKDGTDEKVTLEDYRGDVTEDKPSGLAAFVEKDDISIVCVPNENDVDLSGLSDAVVSHCELMQDRFAILQAKKDAELIDDLYPGDGKLDSKYAAFYYPWITINDPVTNMPQLIPPGGHIAGVYARSDIERGVHKTPANEPIRGVIDVQFNVTKRDQEILNPRGVNCIRSFTGRGILVWGGRTISVDPLWKYVNVRRLLLFLEKSIERATQWVVFEPNNERLWARVRQSVSDFLTQVWKDGALMGTTPEQAFFVKCDQTTMTADQIETGKLIIVVGVAPARPAEFVIFRLAQWRSGTSLTE